MLHCPAAARAASGVVGGGVEEEGEGEGGEDEEEGGENPQADATLRGGQG